MLSPEPGCSHWNEELEAKPDGDDLGMVDGGSTSELSELHPNTSTRANADPSSAITYLFRITVWGIMSISPNTRPSFRRDGGPLLYQCLDSF